MARRKAKFSSKYSSLSYRPLDEIQTVINQLEVDVATFKLQVERAQVEFSPFVQLLGRRRELEQVRESLVSADRKALGVMGGLLNITRMGLSIEASTEVGQVDREILRLNQKLNFDAGVSHRMRVQFRYDDAKKALGKVEYALRSAEARLQSARSDLDGATRRIEREAKQSQAADRRKQKNDLERAVVEAARGRTREHANKVRREIRIQMKILEICPYCDGPLGDNPQADHIYPVKRGGLSTVENMVYVCQPCNQRKSDKTLREFIIISTLNRESIEQRLMQLGKRF